ncbi:MAG: SLBB domain-containing protein [Acidobacteria bacterium]|nr:SLBB domain-containing protein [Acidobacteriota bacterium]
MFLILHAFSYRAAGQTPTPTPSPDGGRGTGVEDEFDLIHYGDLIDVDIVGSTDYDWRGTLTPEGFLDGIEALPGPVFGLCRSEESVAAEIARGMSKFLRDPQVVVRVLDRSNRPNSTLYGAVRIPQRFLIKRPVFLNELLVLAGGFTEKASGEIQIYRPKSLSCTKPKAAAGPDSNRADNSRERYIATREDNGSQFINIRITDLLAGKKDSNLQILAGDVINVMEAQPIYVIGGVTTPRLIASRSQMTVARAIAGAGGISKDADPARVTIFRRSGLETKTIEVDLDKIKAGQADDVVLQAFDIVEVAIKGSAKRKFPPVVRGDEPGGEGGAKLPLRIID